MFSTSIHIPMKSLAHVSSIFDPISLWQLLACLKYVDHVILQFGKTDFVSFWYFSEGIINHTVDGLQFILQYCQYVAYWMIGWLMNCKRFGSKWSQPHQDIMPAFLGGMVCFRIHSGIWLQKLRNSVKTFFGLGDT